MKNKTEIMNPAGLWIDHAKAVIVIISPGGEKKTEILSHVEMHPSRMADMETTVSYGNQPAKADDRQLHEFTVHINKYYQKVIAEIKDSDAILIFGPGEGTGEFKKQLEHAKLSDRVVAVETAGKMTDGQIAAKVRDYFQK